MRRVSSALIAAGFSPRTESTEPLHRQLYRIIRGQILSGALKSGDRLPSTRVLAKDLRLGRNTVMPAFEQLTAEGYLKAEVGSGTYVAAELPAKPQVRVTRERAIERETPWSRWARQITAGNLAAFTGPLFRPFQPGLPDLNAFPAHIWTRLLGEARRSSTLLGYGHAQGYLPLRKAIAAYLSVARGVTCHAEQIVIVSGTQQALDLIARLLLDPGDTVAVENPGYTAAHAALQAVSTHLIPVSVEPDASTVWALPLDHSHCRLAYLTPSNQFPTGISMGVPKRLEWLKWARETGTYLIEDDYDSEFRYDSRPLSSMQGLDSHGVILYIGSFSKLLFPALRLGYLVLPQHLIQTFVAAKVVTDLNSSLLQQAALCEFIEQGHLGRHIRRMRSLYKERLAVITEALQQELSDELSMNSSEAGMHVCVRFLFDSDDIAICDVIRAAGLSAIPLSACYVCGPKAHGLLLGFAAYTPKQINSGVRKLARLLKDKRNWQRRPA